MKKSVKYITLSISSIITFFSIILMISIYADINTLEHPTTLIMPSILFCFFIATFVLLTIWGFKFSNGKSHKSYIVITIVLLVVTIVFGFATKAINNSITDNSSTGEYTLQNYIYTDEVTELFETLTSTSYDVLPMPDVDNSEENEIIKSYLISDDDNSDIHISFTYNKTTNALTFVNMFTETTNSLFDLQNLSNNVVSCLDKDIDTYEFVTKTNIMSSETTDKIVEFKKFTFFYSITDKYRTASFTIK